MADINVNEEKLIVLMKEHFPSKEEFGALSDEVSNLGGKVGSLREDVDEMKETFVTKGEFLSAVKDIRGDIGEMRELLEESKATSGVVDTMLEAHVVERVDRLEANAGLPKYEAVTGE